MDTFEDFLRSSLDHGHTQIKLVPRYAADGSVAFYACGQGGPISGETFDGSVGGNSIGGPEEVAEVYATVEEVDALMEQPVEPYPEDKGWG